MAMVIGRRVLGAFVIALCAGSGLDSKLAAGAEEDADDTEKWDKLGSEAFADEEGKERRREVVEQVLGEGKTQGWCDEQVSKVP
jgi:COP9 signalosome complex subunit 4